ncbi:adenylate/guanylate cyclase domain-containing protein [Thalassospira sp. HF15]|uniref:adenylate/guanylate cyclase domain-containing protein n=1 Tax=Thalassospira sp. HF15 TaxID=2722755 RepID=UPI00142FC716|nr:adenylate/guanylate cyclase domain-containing protein [Thalassospira sp. HF15]NIY74587.1 adenylate/guanylate cyclase domain-containing protein [Thalassospira sp. HF15]
MKLSNQRFSIFVVLLAGLIITSVSGVGLAVYFGLKTAQENTVDLWISRSGDDLADAQRAVDKRMNRLAQRNNHIVEKVAQNRLDLRDAGFWQNHALSYITGESDIAAIGLASPDGTFIGYNPQSKRLIKGPADLMETRLVEQLPLAGPAVSQAIFPFWHNQLKQVVIGEAAPVYQNGQYIGLLMQYLTLAGLSSELHTSNTGNGRTGFIMIGDRLIAHPGLIAWQNTKTGNDTTPFIAKTLEEALSALPSAKDINDPVLAQQDLWNEIDFGQEVESPDDRPIVIHHVNVEDQDHFIITQPADKYASTPITMGMHFSPSIFAAEIQRLDQLGVIGLVALAGAIIAAAVIAHLFSRPLKRISLASRQLETEDINALPSLPNSLIREFDDASNSFNNMVATLKDRERIGRLFGKFLPPPIALKLLQSTDDTGAIPSRKCIASILFVDLQGFTSMCENADPQNVVDVLNAYFAKATTIIEANKGIITQFQGDAILAVFNAVDDQPNHADLAVKSAIEIQQLAHSQTFLGQSLKCRCGVNTGELVAGNVGAPDRLTFTVNGDAVNSAARLEAMNKELGTKILIGETTREQMSNSAETILVKEVMLRGRSTPSSVYTVRIEGVEVDLPQPTNQSK